MPGCYCANNHGSIVNIKGEWYIFYHRHTNGTNYSRQGCFEKLRVKDDILFEQAEITSCGSTPFTEKGFYPAYLACNLFTDVEELSVPWSGWMDDRFPKITQEGRDGDEINGYVCNMRDTARAGFKYFDCHGLKVTSVRTKGYANGRLEVRTKWDGPCLGSFPISYANIWHDTEGNIELPDGVNSLYFTFSGDGYLQFGGFTIG
jgi:hypothetical protein